MEQSNFSLPGGYIGDSGRLHKQVELRALTGGEEELLVQIAPRGAAAQVTAVLCSCVKRIGSVHHITEDVVRDLLVGDRQYLMLKLRELTFGDRVQASVICAWPDCGSKLDIDFSISDIPVDSVEHTELIHEYAIPMCEAADRSDTAIWFRLPNGHDQEAMTRELPADDACALTHLLWRCVRRIGQVEDPSLEQIRELPTYVRRQIEKRMQALAPDLNLTMEAACPECERRFDIPFSLQEFFFDEMRTSQDLLRREVHYLAYHYHWSENDILAMTRNKRRNYIEILADEIERQNDGVRSGAGG
jgi:phage FluMu protein gp41